MTNKTVSFAEAADAWILDLEKQVVAGGRKKRNVVDYAPTIERYLKPYFAGRNADNITTADIGKYGLKLVLPKFTSSTIPGALTGTRRALITMTFILL
jgi:hypothetical protein